MFEKNKVPQGIIVNSWGGTPIEAWISKDSLEKDYPMLVKRVQFFQSDDYVKEQMQANMLAERQWQKMLQNADPGIQYNWTATQYDDSGWQAINQNNWGWRGTGTIWLRQHINIDKMHAGKPARLLLGTLFDRDVTYLNGINKLPKEFFDNIEKMSFQEIAYTVASAFFGEDVDLDALHDIVYDTLQFDCPVVNVKDDIYTLELFHGPTLAFKDVGARFMARLLQYFIKQENNHKEVNVLVATSGDTGSAVANGFLGVDGIHVYVLYPK